MKVGKNAVGRIEREVLFYGDDGRIVSKETKFRRKDGRAGFLVAYCVDGKWTRRLRRLSRWCASTATTADSGGTYK